MATNMPTNPVDSTQTNASTLSNWAAPYVVGMLGQTQALGQQGYTPYAGQRVAGFSDLQNQAFGGIAGLQLPANFGQASGMLGGIGEQAMGIAGSYQPGQFGTGSFTDEGVMGKYMTPYQQGVTDIATREARRQAGISGQGDAAKAVQQGAFGGYRHGLVEAENERNLQTRIGDIQTKGLQDAFTAAQSQFNNEANRNLTAQQLGEQSKQFGAGLGIQGLNTSVNAANALGNIGLAQNSAGLANLNTQLSAGKTVQDFGQQNLDVGYNDFTTQQMWPYKQLQFQQQMLSGLPISTNTNTTNYGDPNFLSQLVGGGLAGLSAWNLYNGK